VSMVCNFFYSGGTKDSHRQEANFGALLPRIDLIAQLIASLGKLRGLNFDCNVSLDVAALD
jgi:hypothetical protein